MNPENVDLLRQALPFINKFKGQTFVIKIGGEIAENEETLYSFCEEAALCAQVGIRIVIIHGGGKQATDMSEKLGLEPKMINGRRVTDEQTLDIVKMVFAGKINVEILSALRRAGISAVGLSGVDGNIIHALKRPPKVVRNAETGKDEMVDYGHVGDIQKVDARLLRTLLEGDFVPVLASLGSDADGNILNINADTVASAIAKEISAEKLILASNVDGIYRIEGDRKELLSRLSETEANRLMETGVIRGGMIPKTQEALAALREGVRTVHIINGVKASSLLTEVFTNSGCGTMLYRK